MEQEKYENLLKKAEFAGLLQAELGKDLAEVREHLSVELNKQTTQMYKGFESLNDKLSEKIDRVNSRVDKMIYTTYGMIFTLVMGFGGVIITIIMKG